MKKTPLLLVTLAFAAAMSACKAERRATEPKKLSAELDKTAHITLNGREYTAHLRRGGDGIWECAFSEPECLAGLTMTCDPEGSRMAYEGLEYYISPENMPEYGLMPLLTSALDDVAEGRDISCTEAEGCIRETGQAAGQSFTAEVKDGGIVSLEIAGVLSAEFE
ncbi:hypothetical protein [Ruminococcus sp.]|uniref:hypothetical protein n=1 Tax=Ruminococcus sp. TaxID=41978 RepID=UPI0025EE9A77|nr:hypothetical protein [Ruminococcus sp.]MBQ8966171.1 hypothetical protein [Ruminococcus sp.]